VDGRVKKAAKWNIFVDGASNEHGSMVGIVIVTTRGRKLCYTLRLDFSMTNNDVEYEAATAGLEIAIEIGIRSLCIHSDSQLVVN